MQVATMTGAEARLRKARGQALFSQPFFATSMIRLELVEKIGIGTFATDGTSLFYDPAFVMGNPPDKPAMSMDDLTFVLCHEVMHVLLLHHTRRGHRDPEDWNRATDYAINALLVKSGFHLMKDVLHDPAFDGMTAEKIYDLIHKPPQQGGQGNKPSGQQPQPGQGQGQPGQGKPQQGPGQPIPKTPGGIGQVIDAPVSTKADLKAEEDKWKGAAIQSAMAAKAAGKMPGELERLVDKMMEAKLDWRAVLRRFVDETIVSDYTWTKPNRRFIAYDVYLPSPVKEGCPDLCIAVDCSGSISPALLNQFAGEINEIQEEVKPASITVLYFDTKVHHVDRFEQGDTIALKGYGFGGTDFNCVFKWIEKQGIEPKALIFLTDLYGPYPAEAPEYATLWACTSGQVARWGETVPFELADAD